MGLVHNERIKLLSAALNNLGIGVILAGLIAPMVNGTVGGLGHAIGWVLLGADLIGMAHLVLGRLRP